MLLPDNDQVKSALNLFCKDLGIVQTESQACSSPIPIATAALQQFLTGKSLGLGHLDDSQILKVYQQSSPNTSLLQKKDTWLLPSGEEEEIFNVSDELRHEVVIDIEIDDGILSISVSAPSSFYEKNSEDVRKKKCAQKVFKNVL